MKIGDKIQWTNSGIDQFTEPKAVRYISDCGQYCFVEGCDTGMPIAETTIILPEEKFTYFFTEIHPFSQWYRCDFIVDGTKFNCAEQYMMAGKAALFGDMEILKRIMASDVPSTQKRLGKAVRWFNKAKWDATAKDVVYKGNYAKFTQNPELLAQLMGTKGTTLAEASPFDKIWGIGVSEFDPRCLKRSTWLGTNWLGEVLTKVRDDLTTST